MTNDHISDPRIPVDRGWAWMALLGSFMCQWLVGGLMKSSGVIFVDILDTFKASTAVTAWLPSISLAVFSISGAVSTGLAIRTSQRLVAILGGSLMLIGLSVNFFATDLVHVILGYGIVTGIGAGMSYYSSITMVGYYFVKRRAIANSIATCGASIGMLTFPPLIRTLVSRYTLRGALLFLGGLVFNIVAFGALFRPLDFYKRGRRLLNDTSSKSVPVSVQPPSDQESTNRNNGKHTVCSKSLNSKSMENINSEKHMLPFRDRSDTYDHGAVCRYNIPETIREPVEEIDVLRKLERRELYASTSMMTILTQEIPQILKEADKKVFSGVESVAEPCTHYCRDMCPCLPCILSIRKRGSKNEGTAPTQTMYDFTLLKNPVFILILILFTCGHFATITLIIFLPAKAEEIHISREKASMLTSVSAAGELIGRLICGAVIDTKRVKTCHVLAFCCLCNGLTALYCPFATDYVGMIVYSALAGLFGGPFISLLPVLIIDTLGIHRLMHGLGMIMLFAVMGTAWVPPFQGWLKDDTGTYSYSFFIGGGLSIAAAVLLLLVPRVQKCQTQGKNQGGNSEHEN